MNIIQLFISANGVHVGKEALIHFETVILEGFSLPFCEGLDDFGIALEGGDVKVNRTLDAGKVVIEARSLGHEKGGGDPAEV